jgi:hypothetical protein
MFELFSVRILGQQLLRLEKITLVTNKLNHHEHVFQ